MTLPLASAFLLGAICAGIPFILAARRLNQQLDASNQMLRDHLDWLAERPHPFVRLSGPPDETCTVCGKDPRNSIHQGKPE